VVANEACAAGLPVLVSPHAGVAGELVVDGKNGYVCALDTAIWAEHAATLLQDDALRTRFAQQSLHQVGSYRFELAAQGIVDACRAATQVPAGSRQFNAGIP
jgi:glycosyltransferase involved in cell wall biosynthesis